MYLDYTLKMKTGTQNCHQSMQVYPKAVYKGRYYTYYTLQTCQPHQDLPQQALPMILQ
jgi:hypothetical protein